jgi:hypothetical protein
LVVQVSEVKRYFVAFPAFCVSKYGHPRPIGESKSYLRGTESKLVLVRIPFPTCSYFS